MSNVHRVEVEGGDDRLASHYLVCAYLWWIITRRWLGGGLVHSVWTCNDEVLFCREVLWEVGMLISMC
jgi:hypothetical protein